MVTHLFKNSNIHSLQNLPRIPFAFPRRDRVISAQSLGGVAQPLKVVRQNPRCYQHIHARVEKVLFLEALLPERRQPTGIDLHQTDVT